ncbi:MAG: zinc dependent phospholipase C family protein [Planctomycetota bacterium]
MSINTLVLCLILTVFARIVGSSSWGPGTHIHFALRLLDRMHGRLQPQQCKLLDEHRDAFLYGNIAADIINFKRYGGLRNHCHNWNVKERFEALIDAEHEYAFLYGYLCHLAADVVAHNHFVPYHILYDLPPRLLGHTYWEARADDPIAEEVWDQIDTLRNARELHANDEIINQAVRRKALSLTSNKWIFNNVLLARSKRAWRDVMEQMRTRKPRRELQDDFLERCHEAAIANMWSVFDDLELRAMRDQDPNGLECLQEARKTRRRLILKYGSREAGAQEARVVATRNYDVKADGRR